MQVLIVDDDDFALSVLGHTMQRIGYSVLSAHDGNAAMDVLRLGEIRLVITDWDMAGMNGVDLCRAIRREDLSGYVYVIMLTGREGSKQRMEGLRAGADDFLNKPLDPEELLLCLKTAERILSLETRDLALFALAKLAESRDAETGSHIERVQNYTRLIAQHLSIDFKAAHGVDDEYVRLLYQTSPLHDLGKVTIPDSILLKPGPLTPEEFAIMKAHTGVGAQTLDAALQRFPNARFLQTARDIAASHHERFDGTGYPQGLAGRRIPLCGRIFAVADAYDVMTNPRCYKQAMPHEQAKAILLAEREKQFDPDAVDAFMRAEESILIVRESLRDNDVAIETREPAELAAKDLPPVSGRLGSCGILIADDDTLLREKLAALLIATGETVYCAADGLEAIKLWEEHGPRLIVSDWSMPGADGPALCRHIRARSEPGSAHFIMLTAHSDKGRLLDAYQSGVDDFVSKPCDYEELLARVRAGIRTASLRDELLRKASGSQAMSAHLATMNSRLERLSVTDELTGLFNRRHATHRLAEQWGLAQAHGRPLSLAMIDIDFFKRINDTRGHDAGDAVLKGVVAVLREQTRGMDSLCRFGGEEFLAILPLQAIDEARDCAERFRAAVEAQVFVFEGVEIRATVSIGVASRSPAFAQVSELLKAADQALYMAKGSGRNRVCAAEGSQPVAAPQSSGVTAPVEQKPDAPGAATSEPNFRAQPPVDLEALRKRCGDDPWFEKQVKERFCNQAGGEVQKIAGALAAGNATLLARSAHSLKSMAAYVAAGRAVELASKIEDLGRAGALAEIAPLVEQLNLDIQEASAWIAHHAVENATQPAAL